MDGSAWPNEIICASHACGMDSMRTDSGGTASCFLFCCPVYVSYRFLDPAASAIRIFAKRCVPRAQSVEKGDKNDLCHCFDDEMLMLVCNRRIHCASFASIRFIDLTGICIGLKWCATKSIYAPSFVGCCWHILLGRELRIPLRFPCFNYGYCEWIGGSSGADRKYFHFPFGRHNLLPLWSPIIKANHHSHIFERRNNKQ